MRRFDRLLVLWVAPKDGSRHVIGYLSRQNGEYSFTFDSDAQKAMSSGFIPPTEFRDALSSQVGDTQVFRSRYLFPIFSQRIPHPLRADYESMLSSWGVEDRDDMFEILARSGGIQMTDRIELAEYRSPDDPLITPLEFRIARPNRSFEVGEAVVIQRDPRNPYDAYAAHVVDSARHPIGFVPRHYSKLVARLVDSGVTLSGNIVRELMVPEYKWVARIQRTSSGEPDWSSARTS